MSEGPEEQVEGELPQWLADHMDRMKRIGEEDLRRVETLARMQSQLIFIDAAGRVPGSMSDEVKAELQRLRASAIAKANAELVGEITNPSSS